MSSIASCIEIPAAHCPQVRAKVGIAATISSALIGAALGILAGTSLGIAIWGNQVLPSPTVPPQMSTGVANPPSALPAVSPVDQASPKILHSALHRTHAQPQIGHRQGRSHASKSGTQALSSQPATPNLPGPSAGHSAFFIEGDVTTVGLDSSAAEARIETYEGTTFTIASSDIHGNLSNLGEAGANLHYRCDQAGSCTLSSTGFVMQNARLLRS